MPISGELYTLRDGQYILRIQMKTHADAVIDAFHMSFACASQILEDLALIDGDDLFCLAHGCFIQSSLLLNNVMRRLTKLLQLRRKRYYDQGRAKEITTIVLNIDDRSNAALNASAMFTKINQINVTTPIIPIFLSMFFPPCSVLCKRAGIASCPGKPQKA